MSSNLLSSPLLRLFGFRFFGVFAFVILKGLTD
jgi:hypothetical protein